MNTLWLKIASGVIGILIIIILVSMFMPGGDKEKTAPPITDNNLPSNFWAQTENENDANNSRGNIQKPNEPVQSNNNATPVPVEPQIIPGQPKTTEMTIYVKKPNSSEQAEAEKQLNFAETSFEVGRLPGASYKTAVDAARGVIERWPDSIYAFNAKLMLAKVPERYQQQYKITADELSTNMFSQPKAGTIPVKITFEVRS